MVHFLPSIWARALAAEKGFYLVHAPHVPLLAAAHGVGLADALFDLLVGAPRRLMDTTASVLFADYVDRAGEGQVHKVFLGDGTVRLLEGMLFWDRQHFV